MAAVMRKVARQFRHPHGSLGVLVGLFMHRAHRPRNQSLVDLAGVGAEDRVLDVGCGPGTAVALAAGNVGVHATGVDTSPTMVRFDDAGAERHEVAGQPYVVVRAVRG